MKPSRKQNQPAAFKAQPNPALRIPAFPMAAKHIHHKIDALKNWFRTRPIVEKFCALPTSIQSWGLTLFFMGTATTIAFCFFHALKNPTANIALTYILAVFLVARFTDGYSFGLFSSFVGVVCVNFLFTYPYFALDFTMSRLSDYLRGNVLNFRHYKRHHKQHERRRPRVSGGT